MHEQDDQQSMPSNGLDHGDVDPRFPRARQSNIEVMTINSIKAEKEFLIEVRRLREVHHRVPVAPYRD